MKFEWDYAKDELNYSKHLIHFDTAAYAVMDPYSIEIYDFKHSILEDRFVIIGRVKNLNKIIYVVYTERGDSIRIISARYATRKEEEMYYDRKKRNKH